MNELKFAVRNIYEESNGFAKVSVNGEIFKAIAGFKSALPYTTSRTADGKGVRCYSIAGVPVFTMYDKGTNKTSIIMKSEDAKSHLKTLAQEREGEEVLPFAFA